ncbi:superoxide dismutase [Ni] [candidate division KSB1 bacterium]
MKKILFALTLFLLIVSVNEKIYSHCQIPCGIYDDKLRIEQIKEHITTIEKSMKLIKELSAEGEKNYNQIVRWVLNKEEHADKLTEIVTYYFLAQRLKPVLNMNDKGYKELTEKLILLHEMTVYAMKAKQTTELSHAAKLKELTDKFSKAYFKEQEHKH